MPSKSGSCWPFGGPCCFGGSVHPENQVSAHQEGEEEEREEDKHVPSKAEPLVEEKNEPKPVAKIPKCQGLSNSDDNATETCRYYCPLCMLYFEAVYETVCCGHTICDECAIDYMAHAKVKASPSNEDASEDQPDTWLAHEDTIRLVQGGVSWTLPNACPFCREMRPPQDLPEDILAAGPAEGFQLKLVLPGVAEGCLRNYEDSPAPARKHTTLPGSVNQANVIEPSPLRVGDSLEKMHAKMIPFERVLVQPQPAAVSQDNSTPRGGPGIPAMPAAQATPTNAPTVAPPQPAGQAQDFCVTPGPIPTEAASDPVDLGPPQQDLIGGEISVAQR